MSTFHRHARTAKHRRATIDSVKNATMAAPPVQAFLAVLTNCRKGKATGENGTANVGKRKKVKKMKFCLAEAIRVRTRLLIKDALSMTIHSDASKGRLVLRGQMCGKSLIPHHVVLGTANLADDFPSSAWGLASAVATSLRDLATPLKGVAAVGGRAPGKVDEELLVHTCEIVEVINTDAAYDEQLAGKLLSHGAGGPGEDQLGRVFRNLVLLGKDKPHGARRTETDPPQPTPQPPRHPQDKTHRGRRWWQSPRHDPSPPPPLPANPSPMPRRGSPRGRGVATPTCRTWPRLASWGPTLLCRSCSTPTF